jgi:hypothetical protein
MRYDRKLIEISPKIALRMLLIYYNDLIYSNL